MNGLDHLSYSSISTYLLCPRAWRYKYIDKLPSKPSAALVFGSAIHEAVEDIIHANTLDWPVDIEASWRRAWEQQMSKEPFEPDGECTPESLFNDGHRLLADKSVQQIILDLRAARVEGGEPLIEQRIELRVPGVPLPVIGFIDVILSDGTLADFKTSARAWDSAKAGNEMQPLVYLGAMLQAKRAVSGTFRHIVLVKTKKPQIQCIDTYRSISEVFWLLDTIQHVWAGISAGVFPCNTAGWKCTPQYCDAWQVCRGRL